MRAGRANAARRGRPEHRGGPTRAGRAGAARRGRLGRRGGHARRRAGAARGRDRRRPAGCRVSGRPGYRGGPVRAGRAPRSAWTPRGPCAPAELASSGRDRCPPGVLGAAIGAGRAGRWSLSGVGAPVDAISASACRKWSSAWLNSVSRFIEGSAWKPREDSAEGSPRLIHARPVTPRRCPGAADGTVDLRPGRRSSACWLPTGAWSDPSAPGTRIAAPRSTEACSTSRCARTARPSCRVSRRRF